MDSERLSREPQGVEDSRVAELLRVNAELAAELRRLALDRGAGPRSGVLPASRRLVALNQELEQTRATLAATEANRDELEQLYAGAVAEVMELRGGWTGLLRRARARLLRRAAPRNG